MRFQVLAAALCGTLLASPAIAAPLLIGQQDTFEDGTTGNWVVGLLGAPHPAPPQNIATGGPAGANDNYMLLTAVGGQGAGSRLSVLNLTQWAGDYTAAGITSIEADFSNFGNSDLAIRLQFEDPAGGPPNNVAITDAFLLAAGSGWTHATFLIRPSDLTTILGDAATLLAGTTVLRIIHSPAGSVPGPAVVALLGVDNITASATVRPVPEPASLALLAGGLAAVGLRRRAVLRR